ncbi:MAG: metal ABC transporter permease [Halobacteriales archaeon]
MISQTDTVAARVLEYLTPATVSGAFGVFEWFLRDIYGAGMDSLSELTGVDMLGYPYMQHAYLAAVLIAVIGPLVGTFLVHREMSMISDTLAHTAFAGVAVGLFVNTTFSLSISPILTALVAAVVTALLVEVLIEHAGEYTDSSLAMVLTGGFAVGSILITANDGGISVGIDAYLFGNLSTVSKENVGVLAGMTAVVGTLVVIAYRPLLYITFDATAARASGIGVRWYKRLMVVLTAVVVVGAMQIMGVILVAGMVVIPVSAASLVASSFRRSVVLAVIAGELAAVTGVTVAYVYDVAAGGSIVVAAIAVYASIFFLRGAARNRSTVYFGVLGDRRKDVEEVSADGGKK